MSLHSELTVSTTDLAADDVEHFGAEIACLHSAGRVASAYGVRLAPGFGTTRRAFRIFLSENDLVVPADLDRARLPSALHEAVRDAFVYLRACHDGGAFSVSVHRSPLTEKNAGQVAGTASPETLVVRSVDDLIAILRAHYIDACARLLFEGLSCADGSGPSMPVWVRCQTRTGREGDVTGELLTIDPATGFPDLAWIRATREAPSREVPTCEVQEYSVYKPLIGRDGVLPAVTRAGRHRGPVPRRSALLPDEKLRELGRWGCAVERDFGFAVAIEWGLRDDESTWELLSARPAGDLAASNDGELQSFALVGTSPPLVEGVSIGKAVGAGRPVVIHDPNQAATFRPGDILVSPRTNPEWMDVVRLAGGIVTASGGVTSHAARVGRERGIPTVVAAPRALVELTGASTVTVSCAEGAAGRVFVGKIEYRQTPVHPEDLPEFQTPVLLSCGDAEVPLRCWNMPVRGLGPVSLDFILKNVIRVHPLALTRVAHIADPHARRKIEELTADYEVKTDYFVDQLALSIARLAAAQHPHPVFVQLGDMTSQEYADLLGGRDCETVERNRRLGVRGAARLLRDEFREELDLTCAAIHAVRERIGLTNVQVVAPFCRTTDEAARLGNVLADSLGGRHTPEGPGIHFVVQSPLNVRDSARFAELGSGLFIDWDRLLALLAGEESTLRTESQEWRTARKTLQDDIVHVLDAAHQENKPVGLWSRYSCLDAEWVQFLVTAGIDALSVPLDCLLEVVHNVAASENARNHGDRREFPRLED
jgi:pyruvate,water dikinase